jgi:phage/plasmid-like protein (TIGR03299 family)
MSRETSEWLNTNVLVGFTEQRGHAWHYRQGSDNHYEGAIPVSEVERRLFDWEPITNLVKCPCGCGSTDKVVSRSDNRHRMGTFKEGYNPHSYKEWLLGSVSNILGDTLSVGSAGLLKQGAVAWVSVEMPDSITTPEGVEFRPHLLATTSFDGSIATTYKRVCTFVVCDNTRGEALGETGQQIKIKHTRNSELKLADAREALAMVHDIGDDVSAEIKALCEIEVSDADWFEFLDAYVPLDADASKRGQTMADNKREGLTAMYRFDKRAATWRGTAFGVVQAVDTWTQHESIVRGQTRAEKNMMSVIKGDITKTDREALDKLRLVLA